MKNTFIVGPKVKENSVALHCASVITSLNVNIESDSFPPFWIEESGKWQLDISNNWWLRKTGKNEYRLTARYADDQEVNDLVETFEKDLA